MHIILIAALDTQRAIGLENTLPWKMSADLKFFKETTMNFPILMGKNTYLSIGKPLPGRLNVILSTSMDQNGTNGKLEIVRTAQEALKIAANTKTEKIFVIGGAQIYKIFFPVATEMYLTEINTKIGKADAFFPDFDAEEWDKSLIKEIKKDSKNDFDAEIWHYIRK